MTYFSPDRYSMLLEKERLHFWFVARRVLIRGLIARFQPQRVDVLADVGCGTGFNLRQFSDVARWRVGLDRLLGRSPYAMTSEKTEAFVTADVTRLPLAEASVDLVITLDVLEHADDQTMLAELHRVLRPASLLMATVPAIPWLWSERDDAAGHLRRYTRSSLIARVEGCGFRVRYVNYYQFLLFPLVLISRLLPMARSVHEREESLGGMVNGLLRRISLFEVWLAGLGVRFPWGSSLVIVAERVE